MSGLLEGVTLGFGAGGKLALMGDGGWARGFKEGWAKAITSRKKSGVELAISAKCLDSFQVCGYEYFSDELI